MLVAQEYQLLDDDFDYVEVVEDDRTNYDAEWETCDEATYH